MKQNNKLVLIISPKVCFLFNAFGRENYGDVIVRVDYGKKENRARSADNMELREFLTVYNDSDRYLVDTLPEAMWHEFSLPTCLLCGGFTSRLQARNIDAKISNLLSFGLHLSS